jgi:hypothetical protein
MLVTPISTTTPDGREIGLTVGRVYEVLGIEADNYRVLTDESATLDPNEPVLYEPQCFRVVDSSEPASWVTQLGDEGERYSYPPPWIRVGFFEDYFDQVEAIREQFWDDLRKFYPKTWEERCAAR